MGGVKHRLRRGYTRLSSKRQVTIPLQVVEEIGLRPGDELQVQAREGRTVLIRHETVAERRLNALEAVAGSLTGVYDAGYLDRLRDEWR